MIADETRRGRLVMLLPRMGHDRDMLALLLARQPKLPTLMM
jgi:hypothetical protein